MGIWKAVGQHLGNMAKQAAQTAVHEPVEILENAVGAGNDDRGGQENQTTEAVEQGLQGQAGQGQQDDTKQPKSFKTAQDYQKYQQLSGRKDEMELAILRKRLFQEHGLRTDIESGMQQAWQQYQEKEQQRHQVEEKKDEKEKWVVEQKKKEDFSVRAAKQSSSPENKAWGAG